MRSGTILGPLSLEDAGNIDKGRQMPSTPELKVGVFPQGT